MNQRLRVTAAVLATVLMLGGLAEAKSHKSAKTKAHHVAVKSGKRTTRTRKHVVHYRGRRPRGQQAISPERVREIQAALIREHYLSGEPNGVWGDESKAAMKRYQADNGWQSKVVPDSRALIKLGLGPDHADLLNPQTAAIDQPIPGGGTSDNDNNDLEH